MRLYFLATVPLVTSIAIHVNPKLIDTDTAFSRVVVPTGSGDIAWPPSLIPEDIRTRSLKKKLLPGKNVVKSAEGASLLVHPLLPQPGLGKRLPGEDAIFNFFEKVNWQGNSTWSGNKSYVEDCVRVTMLHIESVIVVDSSDQHEFLCTVYDTCKCEGRSQVISSSLKDLTFAIFKYWVDNLKSYNCVWADAEEDLPTQTSRLRA